MVTYTMTRSPRDSTGGHSVLTSYGGLSHLKLVATVRRGVCVCVWGGGVKGEGHRLLVVSDSVVRCRPSRTRKTLPYMVTFKLNVTLHRKPPLIIQ